MIYRTPKVPVETLERAIRGALKACINDHGPITKNYIPSASKRIHGNLKMWLNNHVNQLHDLGRERNELRRRCSRTEDYLKLFLEDTPPEIDIIRQVAREIYGEQEWIETWFPSWYAYFLGAKS